MRLGFSQEAFGVVGGVKKQAQFKYEKGDRKPDTDYLEAIAASGADVLYILTGQRSPTSSLSREEEALLDNYRHSPPDKKKSLEDVSAAFAQRGEMKRNSG